MQAINKVSCYNNFLTRSELGTLAQRRTAFARFEVWQHYRKAVVTVFPKVDLRNQPKGPRKSPHAFDLNFEAVGVAYALRDELMLGRRKGFDRIFLLEPRPRFALVKAIRASSSSMKA